MWFLDFKLIIGRFYKMRVSRINIYNLFKSFINTVYCFLTRWILSVVYSKYTRRWVTFVFRINKLCLNLFNLIEYFFKNGNPTIGKTFHVSMRSSLHYRFIVSIWSDLLCFVDDLCQILGMFSLNSIGCVTKCWSCWHSGGKYNRQMHG